MPIEDLLFEAGSAFARPSAELEDYYVTARKREADDVEPHSDSTLPDDSVSPTSNTEPITKVEYSTQANSNQQSPSVDGPNLSKQADEHDNTPKHEEQLNRKQCILQGKECDFTVQENPNANASAPVHALEGQSEVKELSVAVDKIAPMLGVDPNLVKAIMHLETTQGWYDKAISWTGLNKSILPMNVNEAYWGDFFGSREFLNDKNKNIVAGATMIKMIKDRLPPNASIRQIATLYNNINATQVNDYGARVERLYKTRPWEKP